MISAYLHVSMLGEEKALVFVKLWKFVYDLADDRTGLVAPFKLFHKIVSIFLSAVSSFTIQGTISTTYTIPHGTSRKIPCRAYACIPNSLFS